MKIEIEVEVFDDLHEISDIEAVKAYVQECFEEECFYELPNGINILFVGPEIKVSNE